MENRVVLSVRIVLALSILGCQIGCTSSSSGSASSSAGLSGVVSAGPLNGATVTAYVLNANGSQGSQLASTTTDASGNYALSLGAQTSPVLLVATGGSYTEESSGSTVTMGSAQIRTVLPSTTNKQQVAVTPVTEIATQNAISSVSSNSSTSLAAVINSANSKVATAMGLSDITSPPANPNLAASSASSAQAAQYAVVLASISKMASVATTSAGSQVNSLDIMQALATTFTYNGNFNPTLPGSTAVPVPNANGSSLNLGTVLNAVGGSTDFATAMNSATTAYLASTNATNLGYNTVTTPTFVTAPPVGSGQATLTPPTAPAILPSAPATIAGPPPVPGQSASGVPTLTYASAANIGLVNSAIVVRPSSLLANGGSVSGCAVKGGSTALPNGLTVDPHTCFIVGTPSSPAASAQFTIVATNSAGTSADALVTISIQAATPHIYIADTSSGNLVCPLNTSTGMLGACAANGGNWYASFDFDYLISSAVSGVMYIATGNNVGYCPFNPLTGQMNCPSAGSGLSLARRLRLHTNSTGNSFAYIMAFNGVNVCPISASTGYTGTCQASNSGLTTPIAGQSTTLANWQPRTIDFFKVTGGTTYAYVLEDHSSGSLFRCIVDDTTGLLSGCATLTAAGLPGSFGGTLLQIKIKTVGANTYAYMALASDIVKCTVNPSTGNLSACAASNGGITSGTWFTTSIEFSNLGGSTTYAYITDQTNSTIYVCTVNTTSGALASCTTSAASGLSQPWSSVVY